MELQDVYVTHHIYYLPMKLTITQTWFIDLLLFFSKKKKRRHFAL